MAADDELARLRDVIARAREALGTFDVSVQPLRPEDYPLLGDRDRAGREQCRAIAGARAILDEVACPNCSGRGKHLQVTDWEAGITDVVECRACRGTGAKRDGADGR